jgi:hypothetical protein
MFPGLGNYGIASGEERERAALLPHLSASGSFLEMNINL